MGLTRERVMAGGIHRRGGHGGILRFGRKERLGRETAGVRGGGGVAKTVVLWGRIHEGDERSPARM